MINYDQTEQESLENVARWWKQHGKKVILSVAVVSVVYLGTVFWQAHLRTFKEKASFEFGQFLEALEAEKTDEIQLNLKNLQDVYAKTAYADMASLMVARNAIEAKDWDEAKHHLRWVVENSHRFPTKLLAETRLARILIEQKDYEGALAVLEGSREDTGYSTLIEELKGDVYVLQGRAQEARKAYANAMMAGPSGASERPWLKMKADDMSMEEATS